MDIPNRNGWWALIVDGKVVDVNLVEPGDDIDYWPRGKYVPCTITVPPIKEPEPTLVEDVKQFLTYNDEDKCDQLVCLRLSKQFLRELCDRIAELESEVKDE